MMNWRHIVRAFAIIALASAFIFALNVMSVADSALSGSTATISDLAWMAGSWQTAPGGRAQIEEHWTKPGGGSMIGIGRTVVGDKTVEFEFLRIEQRGDAIYYVASPNGQCPATDFKLTQLSGQKAIFENPEHDFPKRISYRKTSAGLRASIDGGEGTKFNGRAFYGFQMSV